MVDRPAQSRAHHQRRWWSSLTAAQARHGLELLKGKGLRRLEAGGCTHWMLEAPARRATGETRVHLLQAFDEYIIGYTESRKVLVLNPEEALVDIHLARPLDPTTRSALEKELERYGRFLQLPVRLAKRKVGSRGRATRRKA